MSAKKLLRLFLIAMLLAGCIQKNEVPILPTLPLPPSPTLPDKPSPKPATEIECRNKFTINMKPVEVATAASDMNLYGECTQQQIIDFARQTFK